MMTVHATCTITRFLTLWNKTPRPGRNLAYWPSPGRTIDQAFPNSRRHSPASGTSREKLRQPGHSAHDISLYGVHFPWCDRQGFDGERSRLAIAPRPDTGFSWIRNQNGGLRKIFAVAAFICSFLRFRYRNFLRCISHPNTLFL